jgi:dTDP-glucose 4,6-dehydratase
MRRILITGGAGFIGHHLVDYLLINSNHELVILDRLDTSGNLNRLVDLPSFEKNKDRIDFVFHDLKAEVNEFVTKQLGEFDDVIHLSAASHVDRSIEDPVSFVMDNVLGTTNILNWARKGGMKKDGAGKYSGFFVNFSTDEVFGPAEVGHNHKEDEPHKPSNPYAASKSGQGAMGYAFYVTYGLPVITTYTMNNFGERQHPEKLIPKCIRSVINGEEMPIFAEVENGETKARPGHDRRYSLDGSKLKNMGWEPEMSFDESLKQMVEFTKENSKWQ